MNCALCAGGGKVWTFSSHLYKLRINTWSWNGWISGCTKAMPTDQRVLFVHHSYIMNCMPAALFTSPVVVSGLLYRADRSVLASVNFYAHLDLVEVTFCGFKHETFFISLTLISSDFLPLSVLSFAFFLKLYFHKTSDFFYNGIKLLCC